MFLWSFRDSLGVKISIAVTITWIIWFSLCNLLIAPWIKLALLAASVSITIVASALVCKNANKVRFGNDFSRQHAFPADALRERATFVWHLSIFLLFFLPSLIYTLLPKNVREPSGHPFWLLISLIVGLTGLFGIIHHFTRRAYGESKCCEEGEKLQ